MSPQKPRASGPAPTHSQTVKVKIRRPKTKRLRNAFLAAAALALVPACYYVVPMLLTTVVDKIGEDRIKRAAAVNKEIQLYGGGSLYGKAGELIANHIDLSFLDNTPRPIPQNVLDALNKSEILSQIKYDDIITKTGFAKAGGIEGKIGENTYQIEHAVMTVAHDTANEKRCGKAALKKGEPLIITFNDEIYIACTNGGLRSPVAIDFYRPLPISYINAMDHGHILKVRALFEAGVKKFAENLSADLGAQLRTELYKHFPRFGKQIENALPFSVFPKRAEDEAIETYHCGWLNRQICVRKPFKSLRVKPQQAPKPR